MRKLLTLAFIGLFLSGCAYGKSGVLNSFVRGGYPASAEARVADDLAGALAESYPPGHTTVYLKTTGGVGDSLGPAFENALRVKGFTVAPEASGQALTVAYVLDQLDEQTWYSRLSISGGLVVATTYRQVNDRLEVMGVSRTGGR